jgi:sensor histidine kinase regulating citrate/malate metabolism
MLALTFLIPALVLIVVMTPPLQNLFVSDISSKIIDERIVYWFTPGPFFWISHLYSSVLVIASLSLAGSRFFRSPPVYRVQIVAILLAFVVPFFMNIVLIFLPDSVFSVLLVLGGFILTAFALYIATSRYQFLTLTPVAIPVLFDHMTDGVIIVNIQNRVVEVNPAAARITGTDRNMLIGKLAVSLIPGITLPDIRCGTGTEIPRTITLPLDGKPHYYDLRYIPLCGCYDQIPGGNIILLHDSHTRHLTELGLLKSNEKLQLLTTITRHDILNTLTALMGSIQLARTGQLPKKTDHYLKNAEDHADLLQRQIEFTRDYQTLGLQSAQWQNVKNALDPHLPRQEKARIVIEPQLADVTVFADPMLGRVFYNLIDNSLRHGDHMTAIRIGGQESGDEYLITYEDNGVGILDSDKERIFNKGYGKNTGLGLFLTREILAITRIQIRETGISGEGVRFEIHVPHGAYRIVRDTS